MQARLTAHDKLLLFGLVPLALVVAAFHVLEVARSGLSQLPVYAAPAPDAGGYPVVGGYRLETDDRGTVLRPGDRLIRVGDRDLRGVGYIGFDAIALAAAGPRGEAPLVFERDGLRATTSLPAVPHPFPWSRLPNLILIPVCILMVLRAPGSRDAQRFCAAFTVYAIVQAQFYGGPPWQTLASLWIWNLGTPLAVVLMLRFARLFPSEVAPERRAWWGWPWLAGASYLLIRINYLTGVPLPPEQVQRASHACHAAYLLGTVALLARNYVYATPIGRRRLKWVLWGGALGSLPLMVVQLVPLVDPRWSGFERAFAFGNAATLFWMVGFVVAVVRYNVFDIDRLLGVTAAYSLAAVAGVGALLAGVPLLAELASTLPGVDERTAELALAMLLAAAVIPLGRRLRPQVDRLLFPERVALANGVEELLSDIARCPDAEAIFSHTTNKVVELLRPRGFALYLREGKHLACKASDGLRLPASLDPADPLLRRGLSTAASTGADVALVLPYRRARSLVGVLLLGPKHSGDVYTTTDRTLLTAVSEKASSELQRLHFVRSIRQERERSSALRSQKEASEREASSKARLLATASHDIRQPLHALGFLVESLNAKVDSPDARLLVDRIQRSTRDLSEMLSDLLDLSKLESGAMQVRRSAFSLGPLLESLEAEFRAEAARKGLRLRVVGSDARVESDRLLLLRILRNLVGNAVRYTAHGGVLVGVRRRRERLRIEVTDTGPGIPASRQREIFEEFHQLRSDPPAGEAGLGLGLAIVERLARLLDHEIEVRSTPGRGSVFAVWLPRASAAAAEADAQLSLHTEPLRGRRIAVVDDDPRVLEATTDLLASWGCQVRTASGSAGVEALATPDWVPDFVLSDYHLGDGESGVETIGRLRRLAGAPVPAALITGDTAPERLDEMRASGLPVLQKPLAPARLRALLTQLLRAPEAGGSALPDPMPRTRTPRL